MDDPLDHDLAHHAPMAFELVRERARAALEKIARDVDLREPLVATAWLASSRAPDRADAVIAHVARREPGHVRTESRYRFELGHRVGAPMPAYAPLDQWKPWHPSDAPTFERDPFEHERVLVMPAAIVGHVQLFAQCNADALFEEALRVLRRDLAGAAVGDTPFLDTFLLRAVARAPELLTALEPVVFAVTAAYASSAEVHVSGAAYPHAGKPLVSATAALADALMLQGTHLDRLAAQARWLGATRREDGGFGDGDEPSDVWTTALVARVLAALDPSHDLARTLEFFARHQRDDGTWAAIGPDAPATTAEILALLDLSERGFADRFGWPRVPTAHRDRKTGLASFAHFLELVELFARVDSLGALSTELAFIDLIGFRAFNNHHGQDLGDAVLEAFAAAVAELAGARAIRDGGDEFLLVGAPGAHGMEERLQDFLKSWPLRFRDRFGDATPVAPRVLVTSAPAGALRATRELLGRAITEAKDRPTDPRVGFVVRV